jgi:hypothetical protein
MDSWRVERPAQTESAGLGAFDSVLGNMKNNLDGRAETKQMNQLDDTIRDVNNLDGRAER